MAAVPFFMTHHTLLNLPRANRWHILLLTVVLSPNVVHAGVFDTLINFLSPVYERLVGSDTKAPKDNNPPQTLSATAPTARPKAQRQDIIPADSAPHINAPDLGTLLQAEFELGRGDIASGLAHYKNEAMNDNATAVFERALSLSMQHESPALSLDFARQWQAKNPDHIPALFYVTHLALKADNYALAASYLRQILAYDPNADLSQMFQGILPPSNAARRALLQALQSLDAHQNPSLAVLKAGLLLQLNETSAAILYLDSALSYDKDNLAYLMLKADLLKTLGDDKRLQHFLTQAVKDSHGDNQKQLLLYHTRYFIEQNNLDEAWHTLTKQPAHIGNDSELLLLASLLALDLEKFDQARHYLHKLQKKAGYQSEANYYLGLSYERAGDFKAALGYFAKVDDVQFVLPATQKQVAYELLFDRPERALAALVKLQQNYSAFVGDSVMLQADILLRLDQKDKAKQLLLTTYKYHPDMPELLFAYIKLLDDQEHDIKQAAFDELLAQEGDNPTYLLSYTQFLFANSDDKAFGVAAQLSDDGDPEIAQAALALLASADPKRTVAHLQPLYDNEPTFGVGTALIHAYEALGDKAQAAVLTEALANIFDNEPTP